MAESKYQHIIRAVTEKIRKGVYPPGSKIPGYLNLAREFKVSAITSNRALLELERMGLVERRERSGTFVLDRPKMLTDVFVVVEVPLQEEQPQYLDYWRGVISQGEKAGISIQTIQPSDPKFNQRISLDRYIGQGLIFLGSAKPQTIQAAQKAEIPHLHLGAKMPEDMIAVLEDRRGAATALVRAMVEDGCQRIGFVGNLSASNHRLARDGYMDGIEPLGLGYRYIRDANEGNVAEVTKDLLAEDLGLDGIIVMGGQMPIAALPVILNHPRKLALGVLTENASILQLNKIAYVGFYSQIDAGKTALDLLMEIAAGKITGSLTRYPPFQVLRPGEKRE